MLVRESESEAGAYTIAVRIEDYVKNFRVGRVGPLRRNTIA
jgi:hypothetical protein